MTRAMPSPRRMPRVLVAAALGLTTAVATVATLAAPAGAERTPTGVQYHHITFPVAGPVHYSDDFGDCREGCSRRHMGNDLLGAKLMHEVAASDGTIAWVHADNTGTAGNMLQLTGDDGWVYWYIHINNDTPGTDDGKNPKKWILAPGIHEGSTVKAGQFIAYMGDSGDAESTQPHLHFELHTPHGTAIDPYTSLRLAQGLPADGLCGQPTNPTPDPSAKGGHGYWTLGRKGRVHGFGSARTYAPNAQARATTLGQVVAIAATSTGKGYWLTDAAGNVLPFGDAKSYGAPTAAQLTAPVIAMATTPSGKGYWVAGADGSVFTFGDAKSYGSIARQASEPAGDRDGADAVGPRLLAARDGRRRVHVRRRALLRLDRFDEAQRAGHRHGRGHRRQRLLAARDATAACSRSARRSSTGRCPAWAGVPAPAPRSRSPSTRTGKGYWVVLADGRVLPFGDAEHYGDAPASSRLVAFAVAP